MPLLSHYILSDQGEPGQWRESRAGLLGPAEGELKPLQGDVVEPVQSPSWPPSAKLGIQYRGRPRAAQNTYKPAHSQSKAITIAR